MMSYNAMKAKLQRLLHIYTAWPTYPYNLFIKQLIGDAI
jgi:hypothetical protein